MSIEKTEIDYLKDAFREVLEETGLISPHLERAEIVKLIGRHRYDKAVKAGLLNRQKQGNRTAKVRILRVEFANMIREGKI